MNSNRIGTKRERDQDRARAWEERRLAKLAYRERWKDVALVGVGAMVLGVVMYLLLILILGIDLGPQPGDGDHQPLPPHSEER